MIQLEDVTVRLGGRDVLRRVTCTLDRGELVGVIGPPESGKTVLLKTMAALIAPAAGAVRGAGARIDGMDEAGRMRWQRRIGMSFQNDALVDSLSVFDNVAFPLRRRRVGPDEVRAAVLAMLDRVGLSGAAQKLPSDLSGGMRKRVGIARAAVVAPDIGLFDEPIAGLDPVSASRILELIVALQRGRDTATMVVSNDLAVLLPVVTRVLMLLAGEKVYDGPVAGLLECGRAEVVQFVTGADQGPL